jgi:hypothetical protein
MFYNNKKRTHVSIRELIQVLGERNYELECDFYAMKPKVTTAFAVAIIAAIFSAISIVGLLILRQ